MVQAAATRTVFGSGMGRKIAVFIPSTVDVSVKADTSAYVDDAMKLLSDLFGGATSQKVVGGWVDTDNGTLVKEDVTQVYAYAKRLPVKAQRKVREFAEKMLVELKQQAVLVEVDNAAYLLFAE